MSKKPHKSQDQVLGALYLVGAIWIFFLVGLILPVNSHLGLVPRDTSSLIGIVAMPFLHAHYPHLISNTLPLLLFLTLLSSSRSDMRVVVPLIVLVSGVLLWLFGRHAIHVGASGLVFGLAVFLIVAGILERRLLSIMITVVVIVLYGSSLVAGIMPGQEGISWDGHLFGAIAGGLVAWGFSRR